MLRSLALLIAAFAFLGCSRHFEAPNAASQPLALAVDPQTVAPDGGAQLTAQGGSQPYTFEFDGPPVDPDAKLDPSSGSFHAGSQGDVVQSLRVRDRRGATATASIRVGPALRLSPGTAAVAPGGSVTFAAQGGQPPYTFAFAPGGNESFGEINGAGVYIAGQSPNQRDLVEVVDRNGEAQQTAIDVGDIQLPVPAPSRVALYSGDFNGDGRADLLAVSEATLAVYLGTQRSPVLAQQLVIPCPPRSVIVRDLDGDGRDDVVANCWNEAFLLHGGFDGQLVADPAWPWDLSGVDGGVQPIAATLAPIAIGDPGASLALLEKDPGVFGSYAIELFAVRPGGPFPSRFGASPAESLGSVPVDPSAVPALASNLGMATSGDRAYLTGLDLNVFALRLFESIQVGLDGGVAVARQAAVQSASSCEGSLIANPQFADLTGDGIPDFILANVRGLPDGGPGLCVASGQADGGFGAAHVLAVSLGLQGLELPPDALHPRRRLAFMSEGPVSAVGFDGSTFDVEQLPLPDGVTDIGAGDLDGDQRVDLAVTNARDELQFLPADLLGTLRSGRMHLEPVNRETQLGSASGVVQGQPVALYSGSSGALILEPSSRGRLSLSARLLDGATLTSSALDATGAWATVSTADGNVLYHLVRTPDGWTTLQVPSDVAYVTTSLHAGGAVPGDDVIALRTGDLAVEVLHLEPDGGVQSTLPALPVGGGTTVVAVHAGNSDADDLLYEGSGGAPQLWLADGSGGYGTAPVLTLDSATLGFGTSEPQLLTVFSRYAGDRPDTVLLSAVSSGTPLTYAYDLREHRAYLVGPSIDYGALAIGDFDGDGLTDLVTPAASTSPTLMAITRSTDGSFHVDQLGVAIPGQRGLFALDTDGDGLADLGIGQNSFGKITLLHNATQPGGPVHFE